MKLILMTTPYFFVEEHCILTALFDEGLEVLHLRKPYTEPVYSERLLSLIPEVYRKRIVTHDHFYLKNEYGLGGIHLNSRNPHVPDGYKGMISCSCHSIEEVERMRRACNYVILSPIFDSISKDGYLSPFPPELLHEYASRGLIDTKVMAMGGIDEYNLAQIKDYGFGGAVVLGAVWNRFSVYSTPDFRGVIAHFRKLRRVAGLSD